MVAFVVLLALGLIAGGTAGAIMMKRAAAREIAEYQRVCAEHERRRAELSANLYVELAKIRNGLGQLAASYEDVVRVVEREFGAAEELHLRLAPSMEAAPLALDHQEPRPSATLDGREIECEIEDAVVVPVNQGASDQGMVAEQAVIRESAAVDEAAAASVPSDAMPAEAAAAPKDVDAVSEPPRYEQAA